MNLFDIYMISFLCFVFSTMFLFHAAFFLPLFLLCVSVLFCSLNNSLSRVPVLQANISSVIKTFLFTSLIYTFSLLCCICVVCFSLLSLCCSQRRHASGDCSCYCCVCFHRCVFNSPFFTEIQNRNGSTTAATEK